MMASRDPEKQKRRGRLYLILGMVILGFIVVGLTVRMQKSSALTPVNVSSHSTIQINVPTVQYPTIPPSAPSFTVPIHDIGSSGVTGTATFKDIAGTVAILLDVDWLSEDEEHERINPAELHYGTCAAPGELAYPMSPPDAGESESDL